MNITDRIRKIRNEKNISQAAIAEYLEITQSTYCRIERQSNISVNQMIKIAKFLKIEPEELFLSNPHLNKSEEKKEAPIGSERSLSESTIYERNLVIEVLTKRISELEEKIERRNRKISTLIQKISELTVQNGLHK